jgi:cbb3-type cytochrome oxidase subunit 3
MLLAYTYPLLDLFWSFLFFFLFFMWIWVLIAILTDIFRSPDLHGWGKAGWFLFVLLIPLIGVLVYLIARGHKMQDHAVQRAQQQDQAFEQYVREASSDGSTTDQLTKLADLRERGAITPEEFEQQKAKVLG